MSSSQRALHRSPHSVPPPVDEDPGPVIPPPVVAVPPELTPAELPPDPEPEPEADPEEPMDPPPVAVPELPEAVAPFVELPCGPVVAPPVEEAEVGVPVVGDPADVVGAVPVVPEVPAVDVPAEVEPPVDPERLVPVDPPLGPPLEPMEELPVLVELDVVPPLEPMEVDGRPVLEVATPELEPLPLELVDVGLRGMAACPAQLARNTHTHILIVLCTHIRFGPPQFPSYCRRRRTSSFPQLPLEGGAAAQRSARNESVRKSVEGFDLHRQSVSLEGLKKNSQPTRRQPFSSSLGRLNSTRLGSSFPTTG